MQRIDSYKEGFDPNGRDGRHIEHILYPDVHRVELSGNHHEADVIVAALKVMAAEAEKDETMGHFTRYSSQTIRDVLAGIAVPQFEQAAVEAPPVA